MDQNISNYRIAMRDKKWYFCLVSYMFDSSINNAWRLQKVCDENLMDLLHLRRLIILPGLTCLSMPSLLIKDCEGDLNKLYLIFVMMVITTGWYLKSSKPAALIAMQKPLQDVKNVISDFM